MTSNQCFPLTHWFAWFYFRCKRICFLGVQPGFCTNNPTHKWNRQNPKWNPQMITWPTSEKPKRWQVKPKSEVFSVCEDPSFLPRKEVVCYTYSLRSGKDFTLTSIGVRSHPVLTSPRGGMLYPLLNYSLRSGRDLTPTYIGVKIHPSLD